MTYDEVRELFVYEPETGRLRRIGGRVKGPLVGHDLPDESHAPSSACWCKPIARTYGGNTVYEHAQEG
jgi:hypothetical protein